MLTIALTFSVLFAHCKLQSLAWLYVYSIGAMESVIWYLCHNIRIMESHVPSEFIWISRISILYSQEWFQCAVHMQSEILIEIMKWLYHLVEVYYRPKHFLHRSCCVHSVAHPLSPQHFSSAFFLFNAKPSCISSHNLSPSTMLQFYLCEMVNSCLEGLVKPVLTLTSLLQTYI